MRFPICTLTAVLCLAATTAHAASYDAAADFTFTQTSNPNGVWSYGWDVADAAGTYAFTALDVFSGNSGAFGWNSSTHNALGTPGIWKNDLGYTYYGIASGQIAMHPAEDQYGFANDNAAILRFTAGAAGTYNVNAAFFTGDSGDTVAWVVKNNDFSAALGSLGSTGNSPTYLASLSLQAGDTLDFVVGHSSDSYFSDNTQINVSINAPVPEPETYALMLSGLGLVGLQLRRRNNYSLHA